jgi:hypothetical protein
VVGGERRLFREIGKRQSRWLEIGGSGQGMLSWKRGCWVHVETREKGAPEGMQRGRACGAVKREIGRRRPESVRSSLRHSLCLVRSYIAGRED